jgi:hypothetical protein
MVITETVALACLRPYILQHQVEMHGMEVEDLLGDNTGEHDNDANVLTAAMMGNSGLLEDLLRAGKDADVGDAKGRTALVSEHTHDSRAFSASLHNTAI